MYSCASFVKKKVFPTPGGPWIHKCLLRIALSRITYREYSSVDSVYSKWSRGGNGLK